MKRLRISPELSAFPPEFLPLLTNADVYDNSCSRSARVYFIDRADGYYLKSAPSGQLAREATMTAYFYRQGLGAEVLLYLPSAERDWLLTRRLPGEDATHARYIGDPARLAVLIGERLRALHERKPIECPGADYLKEYLALSERHYQTGAYDTSHFPDNFGYRSAAEAWNMLEKGKVLLCADTLIHGDYCLPNILLDDWHFSGFIDLGRSGIADRHIDLFWGIWSLSFNLGTYDYADRFLDAYGRDAVEPEKLRIVAAAEVFR